MDVLVDIAFPDATEYFATTRTVYNSHQYIEKIIYVSPLTVSMSDEGYFEISPVTIDFDDSDDHFRSILQDTANELIYGIDVILRETDGTTIRQLSLERWYLSQDKFSIVASDKFGEIQRIMPAELITSEEFPNAPNLSIGKPIATYVGSRKYHAATDDPDIADQTRAYYVNGTQEYIIAPSTTTDIASIISCHDPDNNALAGAALVTSGGYHWINYSATGPFEYISVFFNGNVHDVGDMVEDILDLFTEYTNSVTGLDNMTVTTERNYQHSTSASAGNPNYYTAELKEGKVILKEIADSFNAVYTISSTRVITFDILAYDSLTADKTLQGGEIIDFAIEIDPNRMYNRLIVNYAYSGKNNALEKTISVDHPSSADKWGVVNTNEIDAPWLPWGLDAEYIGRSSYCDKMPFITAKHFLIEHQDPYIGATFSVPINIIIDNSIVPNNILSFPHSEAITTTARKYLIKKIEYDFENDTAGIIARDITKWDNLRTADKLLIHSNTVNGSKIMRNWAAGGDEVVTVNAASATDVAHATGQFKWGTSSIRFPNNYAADYLTAVDNDHWDILTQTNFTIDFWLRRQTYATAEGLVEQYEDNNNYWALRIKATDELRFMACTGGTEILGFEDDGSNINAANTWYHIACIKVGDDYGIYVDGTQVAFVNDSSTDTFAGALNIGIFSPNGDILDAHIDEFRLTHDNFFSAAPVVGLTDTITIPTGMYDNFGGYFNP